MTTPSLQTVTLGGEEYAVVPLAEYEALQNAVDEDVLDAAIIRQVLENPDQELVPFELVSASPAANTRCPCGASIAA